MLDLEVLSCPANCEEGDGVDLDDVAMGEEEAVADPLRCWGPGELCEMTK